MSWKIIYCIQQVNTPEHYDALTFMIKRAQVPFFNESLLSFMLQNGRFCDCLNITSKPYFFTSIVPKMISKISCPFTENQITSCCVVKGKRATYGGFFLHQRFLKIPNNKSRLKMKDIQRFGKHHQRLHVSRESSPIEKVDEKLLTLFFCKTKILRC